MAKPTSKNRLVRINTQLGEDVLLLQRISGREELGRLFEYEVDMLSERAGIKPESLLGTNVTVLVATGVAGVSRYLNGFITRFQEAGETPTTVFDAGTAYEYRATIHPWVWFATRRADSRIFTDKSAPDMIKEVLGIYGGQIATKLSRPHTPWKYCVQYRETDFNFVSRIMEQEGIYYYFEHEDGVHKLTLADDASSAHALHPTFKSFAFHQSSSARALKRDSVNTWTATTSVQPGRYMLKDYDQFKARVTEGVAANPQAHTFADLEIYDYPAESVDTAGPDASEDATQDYAAIRLEELQSQYRVFEGSGDVRGLETGRLFSLAGHPTPGVDGQYLAVSTTLSASPGDFASGGSDGGSFHIGFSAIKANTPFRPQRLTPKPMIHGAQTAMVVGNGEIDTDKHGRVKLLFHWDRAGALCWARVAQVSAGKSWGAVFIPRVGQEVVVEFIEGDPDRPLVTGVVYNGVATPPYALPDEKTKSTIKTNSSEGGGGFNELRFDDKKGSEQIFIHGEKQLDLRVKKDRLEFIGEDDHTQVKRDSFETIDKDRNLQVKGDLNEKVTGTASLKVEQDLQYKVGMKTALDSGQEIHFKAGMNLILEAGMQISLKVGGNFINIGPAGVDIQGTMTKINSGGSAGSGSGASPTAPKDPKDADDGKPGSKDDPPPPPKPPQAKTYSPKAVSLKAAAASGAPLSPA